MCSVTKQRTIDNTENLQFEHYPKLFTLFALGRKT